MAGFFYYIHFSKNQPHEIFMKISELIFMTAILIFVNILCAKNQQQKLSHETNYFNGYHCY